MKKILFLVMLAVGLGATAMAQTTAPAKVTKDETKVKKTSTIPQKVHNVFSKHKHYSGTKIKHVKKIDKKTTT